MDKFTSNQFAEETTAADIYAMREEFRQEEQELAEIADAQWEAFQDDHDTDFYEWTDEAIAWRKVCVPTSCMTRSNSMSMTCVWHRLSGRPK